MRRFLKKLIRNDEGVALIEFIMVFPSMFLLLFGAIEIARYIIIIEKVEKSGYVLTDIVAQLPPATNDAAADVKSGAISVTQLNNVFAQYTNLMGTYASTRQAVVFSSVVHQGGRNLLRWQRFDNRGISGAITSVVTGAAPRNTARKGGACPSASLSPQVNALIAAIGGDHNILIGEVFYTYQPIVGSLLGVSSATNFTGPFSLAPRTISHQVFLHPRNADLVDLPPDNPVSAGACP